MIEEENENDNKPGQLIPANNTPKKMRIDLNLNLSQSLLSPEEKTLLESMVQYIEGKLWKWDIKDVAFSFTLPKTIFTAPSELDFIQHANQELNYLNQEDAQQRNLTKVNLDSIWYTGTFTIQSQIEALPYVWQLSQWIVKGYSNIKSSLWDDFSLSFFFLFTIKNRFTTQECRSFAFSFSSSFYSISQFLWETSNLLIGMPFFEDIDDNIKSAVNRNNLIAFIEANFPTAGIKLFVNSITGKLHSFDNAFDKIWKKESLMKEKEYTNQKLSTADMQMRLYEDKNQAFIDFLNNNKEFTALNEIYFCLSFLLAKRVIIDVKMKKKEEIDLLTKEHEGLLKQSYIRYRVEQWRNEHMAAFTSKSKEDIREKYQNEIQNCLYKYEMPSLFYKHYLDSKRDFKAKFEEEKSKTPKQPKNTITITRKCTRPYEKYIEKADNGEEYRMLRKYRRYEVSSSFVFWRIWLFMLKFFIYTFNIGHAVLKWGIYSSFGIKSLFSYRVYQDEEFAYNRDEVKQVKESWTYPRSLSNLKEWIAESRATFEALPDTGIFGKSIARIFNVLTNYLFKMIFIGLLLLISYPVAIIVNTVISFALALCSPFFSLIAITFEYLWNLLCYDTKYREGFVLPLFAYIGWYLIIKGFIQFVMVLVCLLFQPILSLFMIIFGLLRFFFRLIYDCIMFSFVKCLARVPASDSGIAWLTSGPGIAHDHYAHISNEDLINCVHATLEKLQLNEYSNQINILLDSPTIDVTQLNTILKHIQMTFNHQPSINDSIYHYKQIFNSQLDLRRRLFPYLGSFKVKYSKGNLEFIKELTKKYLTEIYSKDNYGFIWDRFALMEEEWDVLTRKILQDTFGYQIMESLEDNDLVVQIGNKTNSPLNVVAKKIFEDPKYNNKLVIEKVVKEKEAILPPFASFGNTFNINAFFLPLSLLTQKEREQYYEKKKEDFIRIK